MIPELNDDGIVFAEWLTDERLLHLISSRIHCQRFLLWQISDTPRAGFEPAENQTFSNE